MTDKQIIIDGVPVQDCCYFDYENDGYEDSCYIHQNECSAQNCYYKQLKRKEQECEFSNLRIIQLQETLSQYETDLSTKDCIVETCKAQYKELKTENDLFRTCHDNEQAKRRKFEQCLTEIKEIAKNGCYDDCGMPLDELSIILQKISECEGNDEL
jgi:predicted RNase H-like nuclease (RuvC/YqgF family)